MPPTSRLTENESFNIPTPESDDSEDGEDETTFVSIGDVLQNGAGRVDDVISLPPHQRCMRPTH